MKSKVRKYNRIKLYHVLQFVTQMTECAILHPRLPQPAKYFVFVFVRALYLYILSLCRRKLGQDVQDVQDVQSVPALRAARTEQPAVAEMPTHSFVQPATRLKP